MEFYVKNKVYRYLIMRVTKMWAAEETAGVWYDEYVVSPDWVEVL